MAVGSLFVDKYFDGQSKQDVRMILWTTYDPLRSDFYIFSDNSTIFSETSPKIQYENLDPWLYGIKDFLAI